MTPPALEARGVRKTYRLSRTVAFEALRGVDLRFEHGEVAAIMGASGSGKSTLLNLLGTLDRPTEGEILFAGEPTSELSDADLADLRNRRIGFVFQNFSLVGRSTARANVEFALLPRGLAPAERRSLALDALGRVGLADKADNRPAEMSGGQQQRVAIARAIVNRPDVILADEPTGALDTTTSAAILDLLADLNRDVGSTILLVTHDAAVARRARRVVKLSDGVVAHEQPPEGLA